MKALVTGAGGFCGRRLVKSLQGRGLDVYTAGTRRTGPEKHFHLSDVADSKAVEAMLRAIAPDYVFHLAGVVTAGDPTLFYKVNCQFAVAILHSMASLGMNSAPILLAGTSAEYGNVTADQLPITEDTAPKPYNHYGISKLAQTLAGLSAAHKLKVVVARPFNIIGPEMPGHIVVQAFASQIAEIIKGRREPVIKVGNLASSRDFIDARDVVDIYWELANSPKACGQVVNVCSGSAVKIADMLKTLLEIAGKKIEVVEDPALLKPVDVPAHYGSTKKLFGVIEPRSLRTVNDTLGDILSHLIK
ncbi:MAG: NAD-dependent epimerase/dehydratase family protein [Nitrospinae bacterium]|nr:NAD-dependent epimerase/dehydratase family protein [Nitrospinota bacterium]